MRKNLTKTTLTAGFVLAMAFTFSCSSDGNDNPLPAAVISSPSDNGGSSSSGVSSSSGSLSSSGGSSSSGVSSSGGGSSSSGGGSSSSNNSSSSAAPKCGGSEYNPATQGCCKNNIYPLKKEHYGKEKAQFCDERDGKTYVYVPIGTGATAQTWMAENLNYEAVGSKCGSVLTGNGTVGNANTTTCNTYGRLYDWATAMAIDVSCNTSFVTGCGATISPKHQGICPEGWHIPGDEDWNVLMKFVNPSCPDNDNCADAGTKLKAVNGWVSYSGGIAGTDDFDFSALPGGSGYGSGNSKGDFIDVGFKGNWWSTSESNNSDYVYSRNMYHSSKNVLSFQYFKSDLISVRCLQD